MEKNLADFLKAKTKGELKFDGTADGLSEHETNIIIHGVPTNEAEVIRSSIHDFYVQNGYKPSNSNKDGGYLIFHKDCPHSKTVAFSYFKDSAEVRITSLTIGEEYSATEN